MCACVRVCVQDRNAHSAFKKGIIAGLSSHPSLSTLPMPFSLPLSPRLWISRLAFPLLLSVLKKKKKKKKTEKENAVPPSIVFTHLPPFRANWYAPCVLRWYIPICFPMSSVSECHMLLICHSSQSSEAEHNGRRARGETEIHTYTNTRMPDERGFLPHTGFYYMQACASTRMGTNKRDKVKDVKLTHAGVHSLKHTHTYTHTHTHRLCLG